MSEFIMKASTDELAEFCRRYSNMQELVRCKDCIHKNGLNHCPHNNDIWVADDWFCADGVKNNG